MRVESMGGYFCRGCWDLRDVLFPAVLRQIGERCFAQSGLLRLDISGTRVEELSSGVCHGCREMREVLPSRTLVTAGPMAFGSAPVGTFVLPVASPIGFTGSGFAGLRALIFSGLVGMGELPTRPLWPVK
jgi:hypothetical protein